VKLNAREALLLLAPVAALSVLAWRFTPKSPDAQGNDFTVQIDSIRVEQATPREVYEGYDRHVIVDYHMPDATEVHGMHLAATEILGPASTELLRNENGSLRRLNVSTDNIRRTISGPQTMIYALRLSKIPVSAGELTLKSTIPGRRYVYRTAAGLTKTVASGPKTISVVVRKEGEHVRVPTVSRYRPFRIKTLTVEKVNAANRMTNEDTLIRLVVEKTSDGINDFGAKCQTRGARLVDARGNEYSAWPANSYKYVVQESVRGVEANSPVSIREYRFPLGAVPKSAGRVTFKTEVSYDDGWPLPVEVVVRKN
jgi:hypothetical protein